MIGANMDKQSQQQSSQHQPERPTLHTKRFANPETSPSSQTETTEVEEAIDDGRTISGSEPEPVRPERDVEGRVHSTEDVFDADNRGQR